MKAARFDQVNKTLDVLDVPTPEPQPHEVLVRVQACGVCLSDVHLIDGSLPGQLDVVTPGHEPAGVIEKLGSAGPLWPGRQRPPMIAVPFWQVGQRVLMMAGRTCRTCRWCAAGQPENCETVQIMGFSYDGAWAEYVVVPAVALVPVPDDVPIEQAAICADAVSTPYAALLERAQLRPAESIAIWGVGGLGFHAVKLARLMGAAPIIAFDPLEDARKRALSAGADAAFDPREEDPATVVRQLTGGRGVDVALDVVGSTSILAHAETCRARRGRLVMVGMSLEPTQLGPGALFSVQSQTLMGHLGYSKAHLAPLVRLAPAGRLDLCDSRADIGGLDDVVDAVDRLG